MKKFAQWLLPVLLLLGSFAARASHISAANITYRCLGGHQYEITLKLYRDCADIAPATLTSVNITGTGNCSTVLVNNAVLGLVSSRILPTVCPSSSSQSSCQGGSLLGYEELVYRGTVDLSALAGTGCGWVVSYLSCCRSAGITNLTSPSARNFYVEAAYMPNGVSCNSSPIINNTPVFVVCNNNLHTISHAAFDPDGDSIAYELAPALGNRNQPLIYSFGLSHTQPLPTSGSYDFDPIHGQSTFTPSMFGSNVVDVVVSEYRNGVLIGTARQTLQLSVVNCGSGIGPELDSVSRWSNGSWVAQDTSTVFPVCLGATLAFNLYFSDTDPNDSVFIATAYSSILSSLPGASVIMTHTGTNQLVAQVILPQVQLGSFTLGVRDKNCPLSRLQTYGIHLVADTTCPLLVGTSFLDLNNNCLQDGGETSYQPRQIRLTKGTTILTVPTDGQGNYSVYIDTGVYSIDVVHASPYFQLCPTLSTVTIPVGSGTTVLDLPVQVISYCPYLSVNIGAPVLIHCAQSYYNVNYCNTGTSEAPDAYVDIWLDSLFVVDSTTYPIDSQNGNFYRFNLDTLDVGECGNFRIYGQLDTACNIALLGQTYCATAYIYPDTLCGLWNGANLVVEGKCTGDSVSFRILNAGVQPMATPRSYIVIEDNVMLHTGPNISLGAGVATPWFSYFANGSTFRAEIAQDPGYPWNLKASATVSGCISSSVGGLPITGMTNLFSLNDGLPSMSIDCQPSVAAFDPNDKQGFPLGYGSDHYIEANTDLEYRIRFQNTGTFFATQVVIRDTIAPELDIFSAQPAVASHPYTWRILDNRILEFTFNNIMLPDSGRDMLGSQGFIDFRIKQKPNLPLMTRIENSAAIYFDNNPPVITNTTWHTINENFIILTDLPAVATNNEQVRITAYPNPFEHSTTLHVHGLAPEQSWQVNVYSLMGQLLQQMEAPAGNDRVTLSRDQLASGIYIYTITTKNELLHSGKLIAH